MCLLLGYKSRPFLGKALRKTLKFERQNNRREEVVRREIERERESSSCWLMPQIAVIVTLGQPGTKKPVSVSHLRCRNSSSLSQHSSFTAYTIISRCWNWALTGNAYFPSGGLACWVTVPFSLVFCLIFKQINIRIIVSRIHCFD